MKAAVYNQYGDPSVLKIEDIELPRLKSGEVLIEIKASSINPVDWKIRNGNLKYLTGFNFPKLTGSDFSGIVRASNAFEYKPGDKVFGMLNPVKGGAFAEYAAAKPKIMCLMPSNIDFPEAAAVPLAGLTAMQTMKYKGRIKEGHHVLINACCGGVGHFAVQYAKAQGARVTGICSTGKVSKAYNLGADSVVDYMRQSVYDEPAEYDIILDPIGNINFEKIKRRLKKGGNMIVFHPSSDIIKAWTFAIFSARKVKFYLTKANHADLAELKELIEAGKIMPLIHKTFALNQAAEAHQESQHGHIAGKIAVKIM